MSNKISFPITFKQDDKVLYKTTGDVETLRGEPYDTATAYVSAVDNLSWEIDMGNLPESVWDDGNLVVIDYPDRSSRSFTDEEMGALLDEYFELNKYRANKNSRVIISMQGGFSGGLVGAPTDRTLDNLNKEDFKKVATIIDQLQTRDAKLEYSRRMGDFGYFVHVGDQNVPPEKMEKIFDGGPFSKTPLIVWEMEDILKKYPEHPELNSRTLDFYGGSVFKLER